jgi:acetyl-CoA carboxylase biotin carboxyl carrier protein
MVADNGLAELSFETEGLAIRIAAAADIPTSAPLPAAYQAYANRGTATPPDAGRASSQPAETHAAVSGVALESPMIGVFYRSASPEDPPFVSVGDIVHIGQTIGLIEAMKVYSEIPAEAAGRVVAIPAKSGALVQQGQPLVILEPL